MFEEISVRLPRSINYRNFTVDDSRESHVNRILIFPNLRNILETVVASKLPEDFLNFNSFMDSVIQEMRNIILGIGEAHYIHQNSDCWVSRKLSEITKDEIILSEDLKKDVAMLGLNFLYFKGALQ